AYVQDDVGILHDIIRERSFCLVAAAIDGEPQFAYAPVVIDDEGSRGRARFHLARANPLAKLDGAKVRLSVLGPDTYVSPNWYRTEGLVPTWNYIAVEGAGTARQLDKAALRQLLVDLSAVHEERLRPKVPWTVDKVPETKMDALWNAIIGFSVSLETLEGKFKLSQDKRLEDFDGVVAALEALGSAGAKAVAAAMRRARKP
ncbi:MAG TPA: FMN-binding negative transcriptional regulator, partial [Rhizomicrobium sp.]|nr:FMN-binding negative transcriptional regulator [Rhizomicrobium sp.]